MDIVVTQDGDTARFTLGGRIDEVGADEMKSRFNQLDLSVTKSVIFDFSSVSHIGSAGIGKLLLFYKAIRPHRGKIIIERLNNDLHELFMELRLDSILDLSKT